MKRLLLILLVLLGTAYGGWAEETKPALSFGMQLDVDYYIITGSFSVWNLRYGLGIDGLVHLGSSFYLGVEVSALFGFHKETLTDPSFDRIDVIFPFHATLTVFLGGFSAQLYGGLTYLGAADLDGGYVYITDFSFQLFPDVGAKIAWGTVNNIFFKGGYLAGEQGGYAYFGLGARLGLF